MTKEIKTDALPTSGHRPLLPADLEEHGPLVVGITIVAFLGMIATGAIAGVNYANLENGPVANPQPLPEVRYTDFHEQYMAMSDTEKHVIWDIKADEINTVREDLEGIAKGFLESTIGTARKGTLHTAPDLVIDRPEGNSDYNPSWTEEDLENGSLTEVTMDVRNSGQGRELSLIINGLYMSDNEQRFSLEKSDITSLVIEDSEGRVFGDRLSVEFIENPQGGMDLVVWVPAESGDGMIRTVDTRDPALGSHEDVWQARNWVRDVLRGLKDGYELGPQY